MSRMFTRPGRCLAAALPGIPAPLFVSLWFQPVGTAGDHVVWQADDRPDGDQAWTIVAAGSAAGDPVRLVAGAAVIAASQAAFTTGWNHVLAALGSSADSCLYVNGAGPAVGAASGPFVLRTMYAGNPSSAWPNVVTSVAELAAWQGEPDDAIAAALARGACPAMVRPRALIGYWPLGGLYGRNDRDFGARSYHFTNQGATTYHDHPRVFYGRPARPGRAASPLGTPPYATAAGRVWHTGVVAGAVHG